MVLHFVDLTIITLKERYPPKTSKTKFFVGHHERLVIYVKEKCGKTTTYPTILIELVVIKIKIICFLKLIKMT